MTKLIILDWLYEYWMPAYGYPNYEASNWGKIKNKQGKILSPCRNSSKQKHLMLHMSNGDGHFKKEFIHRVILNTFTPNPNNYPVINHKDENPENNCVWNLEWCTQLYNIYYTAAWKKQQKAVLKIENGNIIAKYNSLWEAARLNKISSARNIIRAIKNNKTAGGYEWRYTEK